MATKLVTVRLTEQTIEQLDRIAADLNRRFSVKFEDEVAARKYTRSDVLRAAVTGWITDHREGIDGL